MNTKKYTSVKVNKSLRVFKQKKVCKNSYKKSKFESYD